MSITLKNNFSNLLMDLVNRDYIIPDIHTYFENLKHPETDEQFNIDSQPFIKPIFDAFMDDKYNEIWITGCVQSGKTLIGYVIPILYSITQLRENIIVASPDKKMAMDKWQKDLVPLLESTPDSNLVDNFELSLYNTNSIQLTNGRFIKFLLASSKTDAAKAGYTSRILYITEASTFGGAVGTSEEGNIFQQMKSRTLRYGNKRKIVAEGTPTIESGIVWHTINKLSSNTKLYYNCPKCGVETRFRKENYVFNEELKDKPIEFKKSCGFECNNCKHIITDEERNIMLKNPIIKNDNEDTNIFGISWGAFDNSFWDLNIIAEQVYTAFVDPDQEKSQRYLSQHIFGEPYIPNEGELEVISDNHDPMKVLEKVNTNNDKYNQYIIPDDYNNHISVGIDVGTNFGINYTVVATNNNADIHVVDYGIKDVDFTNYGEMGIKNSLIELIDYIHSGIYYHNDNKIKPVTICIDRGYKDIIVEAAASQFAKTDYNLYLCKGFGNSKKKTYNFKPNETFRIKVENGYKYIDTDCDYFKRYLRNRILSSDNTEYGRFRLFNRNHKEHKTFIKHLIAEYEIMDEKTGKMIWESKNRMNHFFDSTYMSILGLKIMEVYKPEYNVKLLEVIGNTEVKPEIKKIQNNSSGQISKSSRLYTPKGRIW